ncbi:MAG: hypothetical protein J6K52_07670 [Clostridia bacterium]|nr:hypothetical protein [Clostridia bacterium]
MKLHINREKLITTKGQNLNLSFSGYEMSAEAIAKLDKSIIDTITTSAMPNLNDKQQNNDNKENL